MKLRKTVNDFLNTLFNKVTLCTILSQWLLIATALYQRGYWEFTGHFVSDRPLYQLLVLLNFPAILIATNILPTSKEVDTLGEALVFIVTITVQWWIIGFFIKQVFFNRKNAENIGK